jgi:hypothetical protein
MVAVDLMVFLGRAAILIGLVPAFLNRFDWIVCVIGVQDHRRDFGAGLFISFARRRRTHKRFLRWRTTYRLFSRRRTGMPNALWY